jgi:hypothetical protein
MKKIVLAVLAIAVLFFGGRALLRALVSDETKIGWVVDDMIEGFNETDNDQVREGLDVNFLDEAYGVDRELVRLALAHLFFNAKDPATKKFLYHAEHTLGPVAITKGESGAKSATTDLEVTFSKRKGDALEPAWKIRVHATLEQKDGRWRFFRTTTSTLSGAQLR